MKYCGKCGAQLPDDAVFCDNCGNNLTEDTNSSGSKNINLHRNKFEVGRKKIVLIAVIIALIAIAFSIVKIFQYMRTYPSKLEGVYVDEQSPQSNNGFYNIISFKKDGTVAITIEFNNNRYDGAHAFYSLLGESRCTGTYAAKKKKLTINSDNGTEVFDYRMTKNGLELINASGETALYSNAVDSTIGQQALKYEEAEGLYEEGQYSDAMAIYDSLDYYYDSAEKSEACMEAILKESIKDITIEAESLEQITDVRFTLMLKCTNASTRTLNGISYSMQILDSESLILANFSSFTLNLDVPSGCSEEKEITLTIVDSAMAQRVAQLEEKDLKIVITINNVSFEGKWIECENEVRELKIMEKSDAASPTVDNSNKAQTDSGEIGQSETVPAEQSETQASGENADNILNNEDASQTPGYQEQTDRDLSYMLPESDKRYISAYELQSMSGYELRIARNEIYARHGRRFTDPALDSYFRGKAWYTPTTDGDSFNEDALSQIEKTNLDTIKSVESQKSQGASTTANTDNSSYRFVVCRDSNGNVGSTSTQVSAIKNVSYDSSQLKMTQVLNNGEERTGTAAKYYGRLKQKVTASFSAYAEVYSTKVSDGTTMYIDVFDEYGMIRETDSNGNELYYVLPGGVDIEQILRS